MASDSKTSYLFLVLFFASRVCSSASFPNGTRVAWHSAEGLPRHKRQSCPDGTYDHQGRTCCMCSAGQHVETHCSATHDRKCAPCKDGTYNAVPNGQLACEACRSCAHQNANMEEDIPCTRGTNRKCRCKEGHFCSTDMETCIICDPCRECGAEGIRVPCTATNNTICNERSEGGNTVNIALPIIAVIIFLVVVVALVVWKKKLMCFKEERNYAAQETGHAAEDERQPLRDIEQHLTEIAGILGWRDMRTVALRSGMPQTTIDNCEQSYPGDKEEQTFTLLRKFVEKEGKAAAQNLIRTLQEIGKRDKVEKVSSLLYNDRAVASTPDV